MGFHSLQIGKSALIAANYGLQVTGQNLSNTNTTGYSRQVLVQKGAASGSGYGSTALLGAGVSIKSVARVASTQAEKQLRQATSADSYYGGLDTCYSKIQGFFNELTGNALSDSMTNFWNSMSSLSSHVETLSNRSTTLEDAKTLAKHFNDVSTQLRDYRQGINDEVETTVTEINQMLRIVADLNSAIVSAESGGVTGVTANDLRDERGEVLRQLSELIDIDVTDETNGSAIVSVGGRSLVYFDQVYDLKVSYEKSDDLRVAVPVFAKDSYPVKPAGGKLAAQMEIRDEIVKRYLDDLDQLAGSFTWEFNRIYSQNRAQESFSSMTSTNTVHNPAATLDQLQYAGSVPEGTFQISNGRLQIIVHNRNTGQATTLPLDIDLDGRPGPDGEPDTILYDPANPGASHSLVNRLQATLDDSFAGVFKVTVDHEYRISIESTSADYGFAFGEDTSGVLAALGLNTLFTGYGAQDIGVNQNLIDNPAMMATGKSFAAGDTDGISAILAFGESAIARLGNQSSMEYYQSLSGRLGSEALRVDTMSTVKSDLLTRAFNQRESVSGVNEDEETVKLIAYQRAFQSAAKYLAVVDELYETLINL